MIENSWPRIAGIHAEDDGTIGAVWLAHNKETDTLYVYDCAKFAREVFVVIGEGLNVRGRHIPIAWSDKSKDMADKLLMDRGCNMLPEACKDTPAVAEVVSRDIWERMRTGRFVALKRMSEWLDEYKAFYREGGQIPRTAHPLMSATRYAVAQMQYARRKEPKGKKNVNFPRISMI